MYNVYLIDKSILSHLVCYCSMTCFTFEVLHFCDVSNVGYIFFALWIVIKTWVSMFVFNYKLSFRFFHIEKYICVLLIFHPLCFATGAYVLNNVTITNLTTYRQDGLHRSIKHYCYIFTWEYLPIIHLLHVSN